MADTTTVVTFTVMLWYTPQFYALFASDADMHKFIDLIFEETNQGYINSEIPIRIAKHEVLQTCNQYFIEYFYQTAQQVAMSVHL